MKYYKNKNSGIFAYEDNVSKEIINQRVKELGLIPISDEEASRFLVPKIDEREKRLAEVEADITECKDDIRHALIIGNDKVLENLRNEYKTLLAEREKLQGQDEQE